MKSTLLTYIDRFRQNRRERLVLGSVLLFLAVIVSLIVYWQLRYTGITMSNETFCGYEEHVHTEECYDEEGNLICELEEHTHTVDCLINLNADVEDASIWKATLPELTGDLRTDVVNIAYSQLGYTESTANFSPGEDGVTRYGYTRYGAWYGNEYGTWDAMFVSFCLNYAGVDRTAFPLNSGAYSWAVELSEIGSYAEASAYTPLAGDIVFFDSDYDGRIDRVGIVASTDISGGVVTIIEGDYTVSEADTVCEHIYALNDPTISGYGIIAASEEVEEETEEAEAEETADETEDTEESEEIEVEETEEAEESEEETEESPTLFYTASDSGVNVTVIAPEGALPDGAILSVSLLDEESDEYAEAAKAVGYESAGTDENAINAISEDDTEESEEVATALAVLDISFIADGETVEPTEPVTVIIDASSLMTEDADTSTLEVQHLEETEAGITPVLVADATDETEGTVDPETAVAEFTVESFSSFTLRWSYTDNRGNTNYQTVTVYVKLTDGTTYSTDGNDIDLSECNYSYSVTANNDVITITEGNEYTLSNLLTIDGYEFNQANVTYTTTTNIPGQGQTTTTNTLSNVSTIEYTRNGNNGRFTVDSTQLQNAQNITVYLYYKVASASITIEKYETGDTTYQLSGAEFELTYTGSGSIRSTTVTVSGGTVSSQSDSAITFTTTGSAITLSNLPDGYYTLTETLAPSGYELASGTFSFTVSGNSITSTTSTNSTYYVYDSGTLKVYDDPETVEITLSKVYTNSAGTEITADSSVVATFTLSPDTNTSGSDETITIEGTNTTTFECRVNGTYTLTETDMSGYVDVDVVTITIVDGEISVLGADYNTSTNTITITNQQTAVVSITDNISADGTLVATLVAGGVTVDLSDTSCGYTVVWYKSESELSSDLSTCTNLGKYELVDDSGVLFKNGSAVNVALDDGGLCYYKAEVYDSNGNYIGEAVMWVPYADEIMNSSFEYPVGGGSGTNLLDDNVPFWSTTASDGYMEIAKYSDSNSSYGTQYIYAGGSQAGAGDQFAELNANNAGSLYQDVLTIPGENLYWSLYHRARTASGGSSTYDATDTMYVVIMSEEDAQKVLDYADSSASTQQEVLTDMISDILKNGTKIDGSTNATNNATGTYELPNGEIVTVNVWELETTTSADGEWTYYYGNYTIPEEQYLTRFFFVSGETEYSNGYSVGNLIDNASFSQEISYVIEYWLWDSTKQTWVLDTTYTESGTVENGTNVYASNLSKYPGYGLYGSVTGTSSGGSSPTFDTNTSTAMRVKGGTTTYLSLYLYTPVVTVVKEIGGLTESQLDDLLDGGTYTVTFTIKDSSGTTVETLTVNVGETGVASTYTIGLTAGQTYTISESVNYTGTYLSGYNQTVTVDGVSSANNAIGEYEFTPTSGSSLTITFTNTYAEVVTGGPEMPQTGGRGTKLYTMVGLLLICSGGYLLYRKQRRKCKWRWNI